MHKLLSGSIALLLVALTAGFTASPADSTDQPSTGTLTIAKHWDDQLNYDRDYPAMGTGFIVTEMLVAGDPVDVFDLTPGVIDRLQNDVLDLPIGDTGTVSIPGLGTATPDGEQHIGLADQSGIEYFTDLPIGLYLIQETDTPDGIPESKPSLVTMPLYQDGTWNYEPTVVPKNYPQLDVEIHVQACINPTDPVAIRNGTEECVKELTGPDGESANVLVTVKILNGSAIKAHTVEGFLEPPTGFKTWLGTGTAVEVPDSHDKDSLDSNIYYIDTAGNSYSRAVLGLASRGRSVAVRLDESSIKEVHFPVQDLDVGEAITYTWTGVVNCEDSGSLEFPVNVASVDDETDYSNNSDKDVIQVVKVCPTVTCIAPKVLAGNGNCVLPPPTNKCEAPKVLDATGNCISPVGGPSATPPLPPTGGTTQPQPLASGTTPIAAPIRLLGRLTTTGVSLIILAITAVLATTGTAITRRRRANAE